MGCRGWFAFVSLRKNTCFNMLAAGCGIKTLTMKHVPRVQDVTFQNYLLSCPGAWIPRIDVHRLTSGKTRPLEAV